MAEQMVKEAALAYGLPFIPLHEEMLKEADRKGYDALTGRWHPPYPGGREDSGGEMDGMLEETKA